MDLNNKFGWQEIEGWFGFPQIYDTIIREAGQNDTLIEIGSWLGKSTCYLGSRAKLSGKSLYIAAVDHFGDRVYRKFVENITKAGVVDLISIMPTNPMNAVGLINDNSAFAVFINRFVTPHEINLWYSKVKPGGIIGGCGLPPIKMNCKTWKGVDNAWVAWSARKPMA